MDMTLVFDFCLSIYNTLLVSSQMLFAWFGDTVDDQIVEFLGISPSTLNIELVFGSLLIMSLVMAVVKLFMPF